MFAILILSAALTGQPAPAPPVTPARQEPIHDIKIYKTFYEGMTFYVRGYYRPDIRRIIWNQDDEYNAQSYAIAIVTQATFLYDLEDTPPPVKKPWIASRPIYRRPDGSRWLELSSVARKL